MVHKQSSAHVYSILINFISYTLGVVESARVSLGLSTLQMSCWKPLGCIQEV